MELERIVAEGALAFLLEQKGWIASKWGLSETKRRVRFFTITRAGLRQLGVEQRAWARTVAMLNRLLEES